MLCWPALCQQKPNAFTDEDASNPHGGTDGSKVLEAETFVLIDVGQEVQFSYRLINANKNPELIYMAIHQTSAVHSFLPFFLS